MSAVVVMLKTETPSPKAAPKRLPAPIEADTESTFSEESASTTTSPSASTLAFAPTAEFDVRGGVDSSPIAKGGVGRFVGDRDGHRSGNRGTAAESGNRSACRDIGQPIVRYGINDDAGPLIGLKFLIG